MEIMEGNGTEIIRDVMRASGMTHAKLANELGYKSASGVTERLSTPRISVERFVGMLSAMGYEVIVRKIGGVPSEEEQEWRVVEQEKR